jgi:hypothetical protein
MKGFSPWTTVSLCLRGQKIRICSLQGKNILQNGKAVNGSVTQVAAGEYLLEESE